MKRSSRLKFASTAVLAGLLLVVMLAALGCQPTTATPSAGRTAVAGDSPNIVVVIVDTVRSDHVSAYGYTRTTTLNLDSRIAAEGVLFTDAATTAPWTCPANAAMVTGRAPNVLGTTWATMNQSVPDEETTLAELLQAAGYYTAGFISSAYCVKGSIGFDQGFEHYDDSFVGRPSSNSARAEEVNTIAMDWLDVNYVPVISGTQPLFLFLYYFDPHTWYDPPPPYDTLFDPTYTGPITPGVFADGIEAIRGNLVLDDRDLYHLLALYDGEMAYWDEQFGLMLDYLESIGVLDNAMIIITSDHGEMFSEHDKWSHAGSLYEEVLRVPFLIRYTGAITPGLQITTPVQNMDLMPTILDYVGIPLPDNLNALSLRPVIEGRATDNSRNILAIVDAITDQNSSLYWFAPRHHLRSLRQNEWKLIHALGLQNGDELYELQPHSLYEVENRASQEPERLQEMRFELLNWFFPFRALLPYTMK